MKPSSNKVPRHVGVVLDGNRRFAKRLMLKPWKGHEWGVKKVEALFEWARELGIEELTLYAFSIENFDRPKREFDYLMKIFKEAVNKLMKDSRLDKYGIRVNFIGRIHMFPDDVQILMKRLMGITRNNKNYIINFAMAYGGRAEVIDAVRKIAEQVKNKRLKIEEINEGVFKDSLYNASDVDLIIRTGGEKRTSGFLPWQGVYAELIFLDKMWPEMEKEDFVECIEEFSRRQRRFGR
ncbi:MAG: di-trans,poly-cis-decaprenylcistransferase [Candidatus Woesearchaeota archaeon]|nr:MAG: di-trans,poly-cis-decaprenylcistransferase [Candidatus Woesearchaeota archaeon]